MTRQAQADGDAVEAVMSASAPIVAVAMKSLGMAAGEITIAQYRALTALTAHGPQRVIDLAEALGVAPSSASRMCDRLARKGFIGRHPGPGDRRAVLVSVSPAGRRAVDEAARQHRALVAGVVSRLPAGTRRTVMEAFRAFGDAAGEAPALTQPPQRLSGPAVPGPRQPGAGAGSPARLARQPQSKERP